MSSNLTKAYIEAQTKQVKLLLKAGADPNQVTKWGITPSHRAAYDGYLEIAELLLKAGADPNRVDSDGNTPLYYAVYHEHLKIVKLLLKAGADPNQANKYGRTPLCWVSYYGRLDIAELLKSYENKISSLSLLCLRIIYKNKINTENIPSMIMEWEFHQ